MHIKEFAAMTGLSQSKIRFYEKHGLLKTDRQTNGYREFTPEDAFRSNAFRMLLKYGFTVEEAVQMLDKKQSCPQFSDTLHAHRMRMEHEADLLQHRMERIDHALDMLDDQADCAFELVDQDDFLFARASNGLDFSIACAHEAAIAEYYELLGITDCARIIARDDLRGDAETTDPSYVIGLFAKEAHRLSASALDHSERLPLGRCVKFRRRATRGESASKESFASLMRFMDERGLRIGGDALLVPSFLNLDGRGCDAEVLFVPVCPLSR